MSKSNIEVIVFDFEALFDITGIVYNCKINSIQELEKQLLNLGLLV